MKKVYNLQLLKVLCFCLLVFCFNTAFKTDNPEDDNGIVKGIIVTNDNKPAASVTVTIKEIKKSVLSDDNGHFTLRNVKPGKYTIEVSLIGYETLQQQVNVDAGKTVNVSLQLQVSAKQLEDVTVTTAKSKLTNKESDYVAKLPLKNLENPQSYSVISAELLKERVVTSYDDALKNAPGISKLWSSTGRDGDGAGYYSLRGFAVQPNMVNGLAGLTNGGLDVANIERIEVIKGPSGTLFGSSLISYGGLINTVTKKPFNSFAGEVAYTAGGYGLNRFTADINTPLDKDHNVLLRVNAAYHDENSFQDAGFRKSRFIAPTLSYKASDKLSFLLVTEFLYSEGTNPTMIFFDRGAPLLAKNLKELGYDPKRSYTSNNLSVKTPVATLQGQMNYKISNSWTSQTILSRSNAKSEGYYSYLYEVSQFYPGYPNIPGTFGRYITKLDGTTNSTDIQQNFIGDFKLGNFRNRIVAGLDYYNRNNISNGTGYAALGYINMAGDDDGILSQPAVDAALATLPVNNSNLKQEVYSAYASDVFNFTPALSAMASLRIDHFKNGGLTVTDDSKYSQTKASPKFGLVYQPILNKLSIFANYMNGFTNSAPVTQNDGSVKNFRPEQANQFEAGVKVNAAGGKLAGTLSFYNINVSDIIMQIPGQIGFYMQGGKSYSRGIEADISANPITGLNIILGYAHNNSKVTETDADDYRDRRPESAGPENTGNGWVSYKITNGDLNGFGLGFGGTYSSKNKILNRLTTGVFELPAYTILDASVFYNVSKFTITLKLDNITDKDYYKGWSTLEPQMPRRFSTSASFRF